MFRNCAPDANLFRAQFGKTFGEICGAIRYCGTVQKTAGGGNPSMRSQDSSGNHARAVSQNLPWRRPAGPIHPADLARRLLNELHGQGEIAHVLGPLEHALQLPQAICLAGDGDVV